MQPEWLTLMPVCWKFVYPQSLVWILLSFLEETLVLSCERNLSLFPIWAAYLMCVLLDIFLEALLRTDVSMAEDHLFWPTALAAHWVTQADSEFGTLITVQGGWAESMREEQLERGEEESQALRSLCNAESFSWSHVKMSRQAMIWNEINPRSPGVLMYCW